MIAGNLLLSGGLRQVYDLIETKIDSKCGFLDDETVSIYMFCWFFTYEPETSDNWMAAYRFSRAADQLPQQISSNHMIRIQGFEQNMSEIPHITGADRQEISCILWLNEKELILPDVLMFHSFKFICRMMVIIWL